MKKSMCFPGFELVKIDKINDEIWQKKPEDIEKSLRHLNENKFGIGCIREEINKGCSPCPDILTENFGRNPSVLFVSTVYGHIHRNINREFNRNCESWHEFIKLFFSQIIRPGIGIYNRLYRIYNMITEIEKKELDFCFTELVKTVLLNNKNGVSGLANNPSFMKFFQYEESIYLKKRLENIKNRCIIFTCSEISTFLTMSILGKLNVPFETNDLPPNIKVFGNSNESLNFHSHITKSGRLVMKITSNGSYSKSVAFKTIFKLDDAEIYIIPLAHPSSANNNLWTDQSSSCLKKTLKRL